MVFLLRSKVNSIDVVKLLEIRDTTHCCSVLIVLPVDYPLLIILHIAWNIAVSLCFLKWYIWNGMGPVFQSTHIDDDLPERGKVRVTSSKHEIMIFQSTASKCQLLKRSHTKMYGLDNDPKWLVKQIFSDKAFVFPVVPCQRSRSVRSHGSCGCRIKPRRSGNNA